jgi:hypothetical protein
MAIEVDYFAWEKWCNRMHLSDFLHLNLKKSGLGKDTYIHNAVLIAYILYSKSSFLPVFYAFYADDESSAIRKLLIYSWSHRQSREAFSRYYDVVELDEEISQAFNEDFASLPPPIPSITDIFGSIKESYYYNVELGSRYGEKSYNWSSHDSNFSLPDGTHKTFYTSIDRIINRCKSLNVHRYPSTEAISQSIVAYEKVFRSKAKYMKHQGRWPKPEVSPAYWPESFSDERKLLEASKLSDMQQWGNLIEFKYHLSGFLKAMAFDDVFQANFTHEHETILFTKLNEADLSTWDEDEQKTIRDYFLTLFKCSLSHYPSIRTASSNLMLWFIKLDFDLAPYLAYWESTLIHVDSLRLLGAFLRMLIEENRSDSLPENLSLWLAQASLEKALEDAIAAYEGKRPYAHEFVEALENLRLIRV